jgi:hypothetical protein
MILNLKIAQTIQDDYERKAKQFRLRKLAQFSRHRTPFTRKLEWLAKDLSYLAYRIVTRYRRHA